MKVKFKQVIGLLLILAMTLATNPVLFAKSEKDSSLVTKEDGYQLTWDNLSGEKLLSNVKKGKVDFLYSYNQNKNRISKISDKGSVTYTYDSENKLLSEIRYNDTFTYQYDSLASMIGFTFNGTPYNFVKGDDFNVIAITDSNDEAVAWYEY